MKNPENYNKLKEGVLKKMATGQFIYDTFNSKDYEKIPELILMVGPSGNIDNTWIGELWILILLGDFEKFNIKLTEFIDMVNLTKDTISRLRLTLLSSKSSEREFNNANITLDIFNLQLYKLLK